MFLLKHLRVSLLIFLCFSCFHHLKVLGCNDPQRGEFGVVVNVDDFGAIGDGATDDTEAFREAWKEACSSIRAVLVVPENKSYLLKPNNFSGTCKSNLTLQIYGKIEASDDRNEYENDRLHWLVFEKVHNLVVEGGGIFDGKGEIWWNNSCKINKILPCIRAPTAVTFYGCNNLIVRNISTKDAQQAHLLFHECFDVQATNLMVTAPEKSPNTDGIHVWKSKNVKITTCAIRTGDDCISIINGSRNVEAMDITCGPGHGISIGSLGINKSEDHVSDVIVDGARLIGTTNGVRIKTWQGGLGSATNITFQNITMENVTNPIIIDQNYCDLNLPCEEQNSAVKIKRVVYRNITGTSASSVAIKFNCSSKYPCKGIWMQGIDLEGEEDGRVKAMCNDVRWYKLGSVAPSCA